MHVHHLPKRLARAVAAPRFAAGVVVTLALLSAACSDPASRINAPSLLSSSNFGSSMDRGSGSNSGSSGATSNFAVLANAAVTCTGGTISGDVGTFLPPPGLVTLSSCPVTGTVHVPGDAASVAAYHNFLDTYAALAPKLRDCNAAHTLASTITGPVTLFPGVYCTSAALTGTGVLTLDGRGNSNAVWIFKIGTNPSGTGALTGNSFSVLMAGRGQACNVTWWVAQAATMNTTTPATWTFQGNILAGAGITMTGGTFNGNAWAGASGVGDVTFTGTTVTGCASSNNGDNGDNGDKGDKGDKDHGGDHGDGRGGHDGGDHGDGHGGHDS